MALDYVKALREETATGGDVLRPSVKMSAEEIAHKEAAARAAEHENGRYGRFRDQQGNWAIAWQAHGPKTPLIPPRFVEPAGRIRRTPTGELVLEGAGREQPALIEPQSWVVVYEGQPDEAIVATDGEFRNVMTPEARAGAQPIPDGPEEQPAMNDRPAPENAPRAAPGPANMVPTVSIDGFVAQVLIDNARLRTEIAIAQRQRDDAWQAQQDNGAASTAWQSESAHWRAVAEQRQGRINWLWTHIARAMGWSGELGAPGPEDREMEEFLVDAGRIYQEDLRKVAEKPPSEPPEPPKPRTPLELDEALFLGEKNHTKDLPPEASAPVQPTSKRPPLIKPKG